MMTGPLSRDVADSSFVIHGALSSCPFYAIRESSHLETLGGVLLGMGSGSFRYLFQAVTLVRSSAQRRVPASLANIGPA